MHFQAFFRETAGELRKVSWPTWPEARQLTLLVLAGYGRDGYYPRTDRWWRHASFESVAGILAKGN